MSVARYKGEMKDSGIEWVGEIPEHWKTLRFGLSVFENKRKNKGMIESNVLSLSYGKIKKRNVESNLGLLPASFETYQIVAKEDLIFRLTDLQNDKKSLRVGRATQKGIITSAYLCVSCRKYFNSRYLYLLLHSYDKSKVFYSMGGGVRQSLTFSEFALLPVLLPPLPTQQLIATYLDRKTQAIDALITAREEQIARLQEKRASLIHRAVTKGIAEGVEMKDSGIEWIGEIPKHWATLRLGLATSQNKRNNKGMVENNVLSLSYGRIKKRNVESNMGLLPASFETYQIVEEEDLIFRLTDLQNDKKSLRVGRATQRGIITSAYLCLRCRSFADSQYFYLLLHDYDLAKVFYSMGGGVRQSLTYSEFAILPVVLPPLDEQKRIASYVFTKRQQIDSVITALKESITTLKEYRQSLITEAVTGKLDPQAMQAYLDKPSTIEQ